MRDIDAIINAVAHLRQAFLENGLTPPTSIELSSVGEATAFRSIRMPVDDPTHGSHHDPMVVMRVMGVEIRYPRHHQPFKP